ncbi:hypothetical protein COLO4_10129 [Corchorus olitorius]|uniref:C2HC zinc finger plants domain-containing protein n=1 Tax=Corchorus olitorius TaxID=93759 RepID=A0A1R3KA48_9ROSI|nr:hypothetical protein COLO4_10129 [Corchorus olitorius]
MDRMGADMMETEAAAAAVPPLQQGQKDVGKELLTMARSLIDQGKPTQALQAASEDCIDATSIGDKYMASELAIMENMASLSLDVVMAMRTRGGDAAVFQSLHRAREVYRTRIQENTAVDRLASLFAECAIAEAEPSESESLPCNPSNLSIPSDAHENSILAESGRMQIVLDAFSDGSSFICLQCGGLVSVHRRDEHYAYWCGNM